MRATNNVFRIAALAALALTVLSGFAPRYASADTVSSTDFQSQTFSKTVDWLDYVRAYAAANGYPAPNASEHVYIYANYVNVGGFQLLSLGLINATHLGKYITIPIQTVFEHYKTPGGKDAITSSSFLSLIAFRENGSTIYPNSPDINDDIYASFSLGVNLTAFTGHPQPPYVASSQTIPLTSPAANQWTWGLKYTNLNAIWWRIGVDPLFPYWDYNTPRGVAQYSELTFNYALTLDPSTKTAKLTESYTVGKVTNLWILTPAVRHYNSTGEYDVNGALISGTQNVYTFLSTGVGGYSPYKLSIVLANKTILLSHTTSDKDPSGTSVDDTDNNLTRSSITTSADDSEPVFKADFSTKPSYQWYDPSDTTFQTDNNVTVRTVRIHAWAGNPAFALQNAFMGFLPLFVAHVDPNLFNQARSGLVSYAVSDYLYTISYPQWGGTRIVNDPDFTAFYQPSGNAGLLTAIFIAVAVAAAVGGIFAFLFRRKRVATVGFTGTTGSAPQGPAPSGPSFPGR